MLPLFEGIVANTALLPCVACSSTQLDSVLLSYLALGVIAGQLVPPRFSILRMFLWSLGAGIAGNTDRHVSCSILKCTNVSTASASLLNVWSAFRKFLGLNG